MTWSYNITDVERASYGVQIIVDYTDGTNVITNTHVLDPSVIEIFLSAEIARLQRIDDFIANPTPNKTSTNTILQPPDPSLYPSPQDIARNDFINDYNTLRYYQRAVDQGLIDVTNQDYIDLQEKVKKNFLLSYIKLI